MTVSTEIVEHSYEPGAAMAPEAIPFQFLDAADVVVTHIAGATGVRTVLAAGDDYLISGDGMAEPGLEPPATIRALAAWPTGDHFLLVRDSGMKQRAKIKAFEPVPARDLEATLDRVTMVAQEAAARSLRALTVPDGEAVPVLPFGPLYAGKFWAFGPDGRTIVPASGTGTDGALRVDLASPEAGAGLLAFDFSVLYGAGTAGRAIKGVIAPDGAQITLSNAASVSAGKAHFNVVATNTATTGMYGLRFDAYVQNGNIGDGTNDNPNTLIARWNNIQSGSAWGEWRVMTSPLAFGSGHPGAPPNAQSFYITTREINPQNRHGPLSFKAEPRLYVNPVAGDQMVAETQDFAGTVGLRLGHDIAWAYWFARSPYTAEDTAQHARFNTGIGFSPNAISPGGAAFFGTGYRRYLYGASPSAAGSGYQVGDLLVMVSGTDQNYNLDPVLQVMSVNGSGGITALEVFEAGGLRDAFPATCTLAGGSGTGATATTFLTSVEADERPWAWGGIAGRWTYGIDCLKPNTIAATFSQGLLHVGAGTVIVQGRKAAGSSEVAVLTWRGDDVIQIGEAGTSVDIPHNCIAAGFRVGANQVVGARQPAIANATDAASAITQLNQLLDAARAHGFIAT